MKRLIAIAFVLVLVGMLLAAPATNAQYTGDEAITYLGPEGQLPAGMYGCGEFETRVPLYISGMDTGNQYRIATGFYTSDGANPTFEKDVTVLQQPGSSAFNFWAVNFGFAALSGYPGVLNITDTGFFPMPSLSEPETYSSAIYIFIQDASGTLLYEMGFQNFDCATGTFSLYFNDYAS